MNNNRNEEVYFEEVVTGDVRDVAKSLDKIAEMLKRLGNADAATHMGGLEALGAAIIKASTNIEHGLMYLANVMKREESSE